jgi:hypothetical protein
VRDVSNIGEALVIDVVGEGEALTVLVAPGGLDVGEATADAHRDMY